MTSSKLNINLFFEAYAAALTANAQKKYPGAVVTVKSIKRSDTRTVSQTTGTTLRTEKGEKAYV